MADSKPDCLIIGCGYLGRRVAQDWLKQGRSVAALTRGKADEFRTAGIIPITGDVTNPSSLKSLPVCDTVLYAVGLDRKSGHSMRDVYVHGLSNILDHLPTPKYFIYVSSTSIYGQTDGLIVTEQSITEPIEESGRIVKEAEQLLHSRMASATILRFAGIYGPNRLLRKAALLAGEPLIGDAEKWINLIHVWDGVRAVLAAENCTGETFNVADDHPVSRREFYTHLAELLKAPAAKFEPGPSTRGETNRQISNSKIKTTLGFSPRYTSFREGLAAAVANIEE